METKLKEDEEKTKKKLKEVTQSVIITVLLRN